MRKNTYPEVTEMELAVAFCEGKPETIGWLYDKYAPVLLGLISRIMRDEVAAEEVLQDTFVNIWQQKSAYEATRLKLLSWMILIARDTAIAALKTAQPAVAKQNQRITAADQQSPDSQTNSKVTESFRNLEPTEKRALDLIYLKGYSCPEAAAVLGVPEETLKTLLKTACKQLRAGKAI